MPLPNAGCKPLLLNRGDASSAGLSVVTQFSSTQSSRRILLQIGKIYRIEVELKRRRTGPGLRRQARRILLRRIYDHLARLFDHLKKHRHRILPKSNLGKALKYARDQWPHLVPCFEDGRIEFDKNQTEGSIRPTKLGMKKWMFFGCEHTGQRSAVIHTLVENISRAGHDAEAYLRWVFERLPGMTNQDDLRELLPAAWIRQHEA
ncbi:IS66 family transposase [Haloferula sp.]|uniref:IS66 family transposase n=1 Tax=Haloferula sp. TaxID=2497595 RepID=UPI003C78FEF2